MTSCDEAMQDDGDFAGMDRMHALVASIGLPQFDRSLIEFLNARCGADHVHVFQLARSGIENITSVSLDGTDTADKQTRLYLGGRYWRFDPAMAQARTHASARPILFQLDAGAAGQTELSELLFKRLRMSERVMLCGRASQGVVGMTMLRAQGRDPLGHDRLARGRAMIETAFAMLVKHWELQRRKQHLSSALTSLPTIEECLNFAPEHIPHREAAVGARMLLGLTAAHIGRDLAIGEETVITYRKRLYERLSISSHREMLLWYLDLYGTIEHQLVS